MVNGQVANCDVLKCKESVKWIPQEMFECVTDSEYGVRGRGALDDGALASPGTPSGLEVGRSVLALTGGSRIVEDIVE